MHRFLKKSVLAALFCCAATLYGVTPFKDGEKAVFLGDSITHGGLYIYSTQALYQLRDPGKIRLMNAGISGDTAPGGLARLEYDVLAKKPDRVFIMFGMNDTGLSLYAKGGSELTPAQQQKLKVYTEQMAKICDKLKQAQVTVVLITPTPYNQYGKGNQSNYNEAGLAAAAEIVRTMAKERGLEVVEFHIPMTELLKKHPEVAFMRVDNVHPNPLGQLVMAYYLCKEMNMAGKISEVTLNAAAGKVVSAQYAEVSDVKNGDTLSWKYTAKRLPFVLDKTQQEIDTLVPFTADFNTELLQVTELADGQYQLLADDAALGTFSASELAKGINLATLNTPARKQAEKVFKLLLEIRRCQSVMRSVVQGDRYAKKMNADLSDADACCKAADEWFQQNIAGKRPNAKYYAGVIKKYKTNKKKLPETLKKLDETYAKLDQECHDVSCRMDLKKIR